MPTGFDILITKPRNTNGNRPAGLLAEAALVFTDGDMAGLTLLGFTIWESNRGGFNVTFPSRKYGEGSKRTFTFLRGARKGDRESGKRLANLILRAFESWRRTAPAAPPPETDDADEGDTYHHGEDS